MNKLSKMKVHWWTYNYCLFVAYLAKVAIGYGWITDTKFQKLSDKDWIWICKNFFGYGSGVKKSISAYLCCTLHSFHSWVLLWSGAQPGAGIWGISPPKISKHCIAILTFAEDFKE